MATFFTKRYHVYMKKVFVFLFLALLLKTNYVLATNQIEINTAPLAELEQLTGIGPVIGQQIIYTRPFSSVDDLLKVKGIGTKTLQKIKDQGLAYVQGQTQESPKETDSIEPIANLSGTSDVTPNPAPATPVQETITYPDGVIINEILPAPQGADDTNEWIELYNSSSAIVDLSDWKLQDTKGTPTTYIFKKGSSIESKGYLVLKRPETNITLNNDEDGLNLVLPNGIITNSVSYIKAPINQSYNNIDSSWQWSTTLTPGAKNIITALSINKKTVKLLPNTTKTANNKINTIATASLINSVTPMAKEVSGTANPWILFLITFGAIIVLGIVLLFIKYKPFNPNL